jgi:MinD-like ATPase involved in chromosome partitioning or flagellar assembly
MPNIIFTAGVKGGTGKSTAIGFLITYLKENGFNPRLLDMDDENRTLSRFFPEAEPIEIKKMSSNDVLIEKVICGKKLIIADLKAGTGRDTLQWWLDAPFDELPNVKFICVASITSSPIKFKTNEP